MKFPIRTELKVLPADKTNQPVGWTCYETIGVAAVNPRGVTRMGITTFFYLFELHGYYVYYDEIETGYYLMDELLKAPTSAFEALSKAFYVFKPDGTIVKDRDGYGSTVFSRIRPVIDVHQVMVS
jgi:hypothetical protein